MSKKIHNLLTTGLSSELYLLAYLEPNNIRKIDQMLQNTTRKPTNYSKASDEIHALTNAKYLKHNEKENIFYVDIKKLAFELENILNKKDIFLKDIEKNYLLKLLEENEFFKLISEDVIKKIQTQEKGKHKINALEVFCERLGSMSAGMLLQKVMNPSFEDTFSENNGDFEDIDDIKNTINEMMDKIEPQMVEKMKSMPLGEAFLERIWPFFKKIGSATVFLAIPEEILDKFSQLWQGYPGIKLAIDTFSIYHKKEIKK